MTPASHNKLENSDSPISIANQWRVIGNKKKGLISKRVFEKK